jgi:type I restriction enzyme S subunit
MSELEVCELGDLIQFQRGYDLPKSDFVDGPYPVQSSNGILGYHNECKVKGPSITIGRSGTVGIPHLIESNFFPHNTALFIKDFKGNDVRYIYYLLKNLRLGDRKSGSGVPTMNRNHLHPLKIKSFRDVDYQNKLTGILYAIDKKIEINNTINTELEAVAKIIYDYWFVQFDFPDKNGKPYKSSGGKMIYNEELKRDIPEGWGNDYVESLLAKEPPIKKLPKKEYQITGTIPIIDQSTDFIAGYTNDDSVEVTTEVPRIIFGDHTRILKLINFNFARGADGTQCLLSKNTNVPQHFFYHSLLKIDLSNYGYARHFKFLKQSQIIVPNFTVSNKFEKIAEDLYKKIKLNIFENKKLEELRDWLLPMLMNGQVKIK